MAPGCVACESARALVFAMAGPAGLRLRSPRGRLKTKHAFACLSGCVLLVQIAAICLQQQQKQTRNTKSGFGFPCFMFSPNLFLRIFWCVHPGRPTHCPPICVRPPWADTLRLLPNLSSMPPRRCARTSSDLSRAAKCAMLRSYFSGSSLNRMWRTVAIAIGGRFESSRSCLRGGLPTCRPT